ncbi:MAG: phosphopyruvate hydratase [Candidatus Moranbacteria bacterium CG06_land_8_20_14_3_00_40_12]|nr:MAG: phosphopyruvate hydratase [Candidatus Moranbacteria bacterium CG23_combo_of_CG06-09_8_20_14_all_40_16]PIU80682.1 MAG: phosphopyruvate hydratase [Candidatus Moranbacteria bacterium CG06_land_8_20_14_3_00_40_12]
MTTKKITALSAREILDSRGNPTVAVELILENKFAGLAAVPSGASTGKYEAVELRDNDPKRYKGKGVLQAVNNIQTKIKYVVSDQEFDQESLDKLLIELDGTENKSQLGANALLGVSMAFSRAYALSEKQELYQYLQNLSGETELQLPQPLFNIINGGKHADSGLDIQEFMLSPVNFPSFHEKLRAASEIFHTLEEILKSRGLKTSVGDEGGFAPELKSNEEALDFIVEAVEKAGYSPKDVRIGLDSAASSFYNEEKKKYALKIRGIKKEVNSDELLNWYGELIKKYPIMLIEDGFAEDDWEGFQKFNQKLGDKIINVGDDLLVTNIKRIELAIEERAVNAVLIKLNQIGTVSETIAAIKLTRKQGWQPFVSHRSGETEDTFIADLSVGLACPLIKSGSLSRTDRICKYNRLMLIEDQIAS